MRLFLIILAIIGAAYLIVLFSNANNETAVETVGSTIEEAADETMDTIDDAADEIEDAAKGR